jgi:hypothetical protein
VFSPKKGDPSNVTGVAGSYSFLAFEPRTLTICSRMSLVL